MQVFDFVNKTTLDEEKQMELADLISQRDNALMKMLQSGEDQNTVFDSKSQYDDQINSLLNLEQKYDKYVVGVKENAKNKYSYSQFAIALRYKDTLQLSPAQSATLLSYVDTLKQLKNQHYKDNKKGLDTRAYESQHIATVLSNSKYTQVLLFKNRTKAESLAENDWREVEQRGLNTTYEKTKTVTELTNYYLARECTSNKFQHDLIRQKSELREVFSHKPTVLRVLEKVRRNPDNDTATKLYKW